MEAQMSSVLNAGNIEQLLRAVLLQRIDRKYKSFFYQLNSETCYENRTPKFCSFQML